MPSAVHYVGYVEDDETPESIARKFEELERIQAAGRGAAAAQPAQQAQPASSDLAAADGAAAAAAADSPAGPASDAAAGDVADADALDTPPTAQPPLPAAEGLTDEQLMEVFKQTSIFTVRSAADGNAALMAHQRQPGWDDANGGGYRSGDELLASDDDDDMEALRGFWSDADDEDYSEHWRKLKKLQRKCVVHLLPHRWLSTYQLVDNGAAAEA